MEWRTNIVQKIVNFRQIFGREHFLLRSCFDAKKENNNNIKASFRTFEQSSRSKAKSQIMDFHHIMQKPLFSNTL